MNKWKERLSNELLTKNQFRGISSIFCKIWYWADVLNRTIWNCWYIIIFDLQKFIMVQLSRWLVSSLVVSPPPFIVFILNHNLLGSYSGPVT